MVSVNLESPYMVKKPTSDYCSEKAALVISMPSSLL